MNCLKNLWAHEVWNPHLTLLLSEPVEDKRTRVPHPLLLPKVGGVARVMLPTRAMCISIFLASGVCYLVVLWSINNYLQYLDLHIQHTHATLVRLLICSFPYLWKGRVEMFFGLLYHVFLCCFHTMEHGYNCLQMVSSLITTTWLFPIELNYFQFIVALHH